MVASFSTAVADITVAASSTGGASTWVVASDGVTDFPAVTTVVSSTTAAVCSSDAPWVGVTGGCAAGRSLGCVTRASVEC